jgi:hypothetical protein
MRRATKAATCQGLYTARRRWRRALQQTPKLQHINLLRQFNPLITKDYGELIKDSPG